MSMKIPAPIRCVQMFMVSVWTAKTDLTQDPTDCSWGRYPLWMQSLSCIQSGRSAYVSNLILVPDE